SLGETHVDEGLAKLLEEPLLRSLEVDEKDLAAMSAEPKTATTIAALFNLYKNTRAQLDELIFAMRRDEEARMEKRAGASFTGAEPDDAPRFEHTPFDEVIDFLEAHKNWFPELEEEADRVRRDTGLVARRVLSDDIVRVLEKLGTKVVIETMREGSVV